MQELYELIDKLVSEAEDLGAAKVSDEPAKYVALCGSTLDIAKKKLIKHIEENYQCKNS